MSNKESAEELNKPIMRSRKRKLYSIFINNIWGVDLANMQLLSDFDKTFRFKCIIDIYGKFALVIGGGQKLVTPFCFRKSANFILFCIISVILLVEPPYFQGRLIMG